MIQEYRDTYGYRETGMQEYRDIGTQGYKDTEIQGNKDSGKFGLAIL